jgi:hypothetical protein
MRLSSSQRLGLRLGGNGDDQVGIESAVGKPDGGLGCRASPAPRPNADRNPGMAGRWKL